MHFKKSESALFAEKKNQRYGLVHTSKVYPNYIYIYIYILTKIYNLYSFKLNMLFTDIIKMLKTGHFGAEWGRRGSIRAHTLGKRSHGLQEGF